MHLRSESRPSKWMRATPASHSVSPAGGQGRHTSTRVKYPHPSSTPSVYIIHGCRLPPCYPLPRPVLQSPSHPPPHAHLLTPARPSAAPPKSRGANGADVPVQPLDLLDCLHLTAPVADILHRERRGWVGLLPLGLKGNGGAVSRLPHSTLIGRNHVLQGYDDCLPSHTPFPPPHSSLPSTLPHTWMVAGITCFLNSVCSSSRLSSTVRRPSPWEEGGQGCQGCRGDQRCAQTLAASPWEGGGQGQCCQE